jgi:hypothetical protein
VSYVKLVANSSTTKAQSTGLAHAIVMTKKYSIVQYGAVIYLRIHSSL